MTKVAFEIIITSVVFDHLLYIAKKQVSPDWGQIRNKVTT